MKSKLKKFVIYLMSISYVGVGVTHFTNSEFFLNIMPDYLPWHLELVYLSGAFEILLGLLIVFKNTRKLAGWGLIALLIAVFPANIYLAQSDEAQQALEISKEMAIVRLPFQLLFIAIAFWFTRD
ncbi:MAG: DoxX family protein [Flavobacteriales bacterium]|nr:DoxX family protein [Flavobacteriales bacterium]